IAAVDRDIRVPPWAAELRLRDDVVIQRPERRIAEALVVVADLLGRQAHADQVHAARVEWSGRLTRRAGPADPCAADAAHHRLKSGNQPARAGPPLGFTPGTLDPVHRQPAGRPHKYVVAGRGRRGRAIPAA